MTEKVEFKLPIYSPEVLTQRFNPYEIATYLSEVLNTVYQGWSYRIRGKFYTRLCGTNNTRCTLPLSCIRRN